MCPRGLRRRSAAARLLRSWVRIPPGAWIFVCCECCALSGTGLCDELITRPEESYRLWCVVVRDRETSRMRKPWPALGRSATGKKKYNRIGPPSYMRSVVDRNVVMRLIPVIGRHICSSFYTRSNICRNYAWNFSFYLTENTVRVYYKNYSFSAAHGNNRLVL